MSMDWLKRQNHGTSSPETIDDPMTICCLSVILPLNQSIDYGYDNIHGTASSHLIVFDNCIGKNWVTN